MAKSNERSATAARQRRIQKDVDRKDRASGKATAKTRERHEHHPH